MEFGFRWHQDPLVSLHCCAGSFGAATMRETNPAPLNSACHAVTQVARHGMPVYFPVGALDGVTLRSVIAIKGIIDGDAPNSTAEIDSDRRRRLVHAGAVSMSVRPPRSPMARAKAKQ